MPGNRKSTRLKDYNYTSGGTYFVRLCTQDRQCVFGSVRCDKMILNDAGLTINEQRSKLTDRFPHIEMGEFIIMPNHLHGIIVIKDRNLNVGAPLVGALDDTNDERKRAAIKAAPTLGKIIGAFKSLSTNEYVRNVENNKWPTFYKRLWQRNYYDHIIRKETDMYRIRAYIKTNPKGGPMTNIILRKEKGAIEASSLFMRATRPRPKNALRNSLFA